MPRFRPRFSIRTLAIIVTLVCAYFGAWEATKRYARRPENKYRIADVDGQELFSGEQNAFSFKIGEIASKHPSFVIQGGCDSPAPFVIAQDEWESWLDSSQRVSGMHRRYYLWLLGPKIKLPFESKTK